jgi:hypothetical protein
MAEIVHEGIDLEAQSTQLSTFEKKLSEPGERQGEDAGCSKEAEPAQQQTQQKAPSSLGECAATS